MSAGGVERCVRPDLDPWRTWGFWFTDQDRIVSHEGRIRAPHRAGAKWVLLNHKDGKSASIDLSHAGEHARRLIAAGAAWTPIEEIVRR